VIRIVGLGPSGTENMSVGAQRVIRSAPTVFVRTVHHPAAAELAEEGVVLESLDHIYETSDTFEEVYARIAQKILEAASEPGDVVYAVPGHPLVGESAVRTILAEARQRGIKVEVVGSESFIEASLETLGITLDAGLKVIDALSMDAVSPATDTGNLIYQVYDKAIASELKLMLMEYYPDEFQVTVVRGREAELVPLYMLDRCDCDHLTSVYVPAVD
jgi:tetrapyrrole methylase family protein / MazG family protein